MNSNNDPVSAAELYSEARSLLDAKNYSPALQLLGQLCAIDPDFALYREELDNILALEVGVSETLCMRVVPCEFHGSFVEPFWI